MKGETEIKLYKYIFIYDSYDDNNIYTTTNNIEIKYYGRRKCNEIDEIILRINMNSC